MTFQKICVENEVKRERPFRAKADGLSILVVRTQDDKLYAFENRCTHEDLPLHAGPWDPVKGEIVCPAHGAVFKIIEEGVAIHPPAVLPLAMLPLKIEDLNGVATVFVDVD